MKNAPKMGRVFRYILLIVRYQVPQFIEVEDKIFGPLTAKQFIYLAGGGGVALAAFTTLPFILAAFISAPFVGLAVALSFYKVNGQPFVKALENGFSYLTGKKLYLWSSERSKKQTAQAQPVLKAQNLIVPKLSESKLRELTWSLNIKDATSSRAIEDESPLV
jgi:hypothetical protein